MHVALQTLMKHAFLACERLLTVFLAAALYLACRTAKPQQGDKVANKRDLEASNRRAAVHVFFILTDKDIFHGTLLEIDLCLSISL